MLPGASLGWAGGRGAGGVPAATAPGAGGGGARAPAGHRWRGRYAMLLCRVTLGRIEVRQPCCLLFVFLLWFAWLPAAVAVALPSVPLAGSSPPQTRHPRRQINATPHHHHHHNNDTANTHTHTPQREHNTTQHNNSAAARRCASAAAASTACR